MKRANSKDIPEVESRKFNSSLSSRFQSWLFVPQWGELEETFHPHCASVSSPVMVLCVSLTRFRLPSKGDIWCLGVSVRVLLWEQAPESQPRRRVYQHSKLHPSVEMQRKDAAHIVELGASIFYCPLTSELRLSALWIEIETSTVSSPNSELRLSYITNLPGHSPCRC